MSGKILSNGGVHTFTSLLEPARFTGSPRARTAKMMPRASSAQPSSVSSCATAAAAERRRLPYAYPEAAGATDARVLDVEDHAEQPCAQAIHRRAGTAQGDFFHERNGGAA